MKTWLLLLFILANSTAFACEDNVSFFLQNFQFQKALDKANQCLAKFPEDLTLLQLKSQSLKGLFRYSEAIKVQELIAKKDNSRAQVYAETGFLYKATNDYPNAILCFEKALKVDSSLSTLKLEIAGAWFVQEEFEKAKNIYLEGFSRDTNNIFVAKNLARCYEALKQSDSAIYLYQKVIDNNIRDYTSLLRLCNLLAKDKKYFEGLAITEKYRALELNNPKVNRQNAYFHMMEKSYQLAIFRFRECTDNLKDTSLFTTYYLGVCYFKLDSFEQAKKYFDIAYRADTTNISTIQYLAQTCTNWIYKELGIFYSKKAIELATPSPEYLGTLYKNLWVACNNFSNCPCETRLLANTKTWEYNKTDTFILYDIGLTYDKCYKDYSNALKYYNEFMKTRPPVKKQEENPFSISVYNMVEKRMKELQASRKK